jgi:uncharacterized protein YjbJ (UPF0337 family)
VCTASCDETDALQQTAREARLWEATGDKKTEVEGKGEQVKGKVRNAVGGLKDTLRGK